MLKDCIEYFMAFFYGFVYIDPPLDLQEMSFVLHGYNTEM